MKRLYRKGENSPAIRFLSACKRIREHAYAPYLIATGCAAAGFLAQWYGQSHYEGAPFITLYPAVVAATLFGGFAAGLFAAALDGVAQWLWFIPVAHWLAIATYVADALICVALIDFINRSFDLMLVLLQREKRESSRQRMLGHELHHRIQNLFAVIQGVIRLSMAGSGSVDKSEYRERLLDRIQAMGTTNRVITNSGGDVMLHDLVASEIGPFDGRVKVIGRTSVILDVQMAQNLALILHELVANALKYGALSVPQGHVELRLHWRRPELFLQWKESGGPSPQPSINGGFGSRLLYSFARRIGHDIEVHYEPTGLRYSMKANLNHSGSETPVPGEQQAIAEANEGMA